MVDNSENRERPSRIEAFLRAFARGFELSVVGTTIRLVSPERPRTRTIGEAIDALQDASALVQELEEDLQARTRDLVALQERYDELQRLTAVEEEAAQAVLGAVETTIGRSRRGELIAQFTINAAVGLIFFLLGVWAGS